MASDWQSRHQKLGFHADGKTKAPQSFLLHFTGCILLDSFHWSSRRLRSTSGNIPTLILLGMFPCVSLNLSQRAETELLLNHCPSLQLRTFPDLSMMVSTALCLQCKQWMQSSIHPVLFCLSSSGSWGAGLMDQLPRGPGDVAHRYPVPNVFVFFLK